MDGRRKRGLGLRDERRVEKESEGKIKGEGKMRNTSAVEAEMRIR